MSECPFIIAQYEATTPMLSRNKGKKAGRAAGAGGRKSEENFTAEEVAVFRASFDLARRKDKPTKDTGAIRTEEISAALVGVGLVRMS